MPALDCRLGIDVGGTNTDAVILDRSDRVLAKAKVADARRTSPAASPRPSTRCCARPAWTRSRITHVMLGTTHATNAVLERRKLRRVAVIRIGAPATHGVRPMFDWPRDLRRRWSRRARRSWPAGSSSTAATSSPFDGDAVARVPRPVAGPADGVAITSVFAPVSPRHELLAAEIVKRELGEVPVSLSHEIGSVGLLERENATILNAALVGRGGRRGHAPSERRWRRTTCRP